MPKGIKGFQKGNILGSLISEESIKMRSLIVAEKNRNKPSSRRGKTYKEIYGERWREEIETRRKSHLLHWEKVGHKLENRDKHVSREYEIWRDGVYKKYNYICASCGRSGYLQAHHLKSWKNYPSLRFVIENGVALHPGCHRIWNNIQRAIEKWIFQGIDQIKNSGCRGHYCKQHCKIN